MTGTELKARRLRFTDKNSGRALTQPQFATMLGHNPNSIAIMERRGFLTVAQQRYGNLIDLALNWIEHMSGLTPWSELPDKERHRLTKVATSIVRSDELEARPIKLKKPKQRAARA